MRLLPAVALGLTVLAGAAPSALARARVTIPEFQLEGGAPALTNQLQDGFVLGLVRAGIQVLDPTDTAHKLEGHPELAHCDASPCLKSIGQVLDAGYIVRVKVDVTGNSYKSVARLFSTEGAAPAALPIATESKSCDVCTVAEARATMLRLADAVRSHIDEAVPLPAPPPPAPPPPPPRLTGPALVAMVGALAVAAGAAVLASQGSCTATACSENRSRNIGGGVLLGAGAALTVTGAYVTIVRARGGDPVTGAAVGWRW
ncbi:MAG TPA: hypothetical protein VI456_04560 [Polyangia bacterium]